MNTVKSIAPWAALGLSLVLFLGTGIMQLDALNATKLAKANQGDIATLAASVDKLSTAVEDDHQIVMRLLDLQLNGRTR